jgi:hypothetical protein
MTGTATVTTAAAAAMSAANHNFLNALSWERAGPGVAICDCCGT